MYGVVRPVSTRGVCGQRYLLYSYGLSTWPLRANGNKHIWRRGLSLHAPDRGALKRKAQEAENENEIIIEGVRRAGSTMMGKLTSDVEKEAEMWCRRGSAAAYANARRLASVAGRNKSAGERRACRLCVSEMLSAADG